MEKIKHEVHRVNYNKWLDDLWKRSLGFARYLALVILLTAIFFVVAVIYSEITLFVFVLMLFVAHMIVKEICSNIKDKTLGWLLCVGNKDNACEIEVVDNKVSVTYLLANCKLNLSILLADINEVTFLPKQNSILIENEKINMNCFFDGPVDRTFEIEKIGFIIIPLCFENSDEVVNLLKHNINNFNEISRRFMDINFG